MATSQVHSNAAVDTSHAHSNDATTASPAKPGVASSRCCVDGVLIDLNGTLHVGRDEVPGSVEALRRLRAAGVKVRFVTNTTKDTIGNLLALVHSLGFTVAREEFFSSMVAAKHLIQQEQLRPLLLLHPAALPDFADVPTDKPNTVVVGLAKEAFSFENMNRAFRVLMDNPEARLIAIHKGRYFQDTDGLSLGPGPYAAALEFASRKTATVVGKPEPSFFNLAVQDLGLHVSSVAMVGDDVVDDVGGAQRVGLLGMLVRTGKYRVGDENGRDGVTPDVTVDDFPRAVEWILQHNKMTVAKPCGAGNSV